MHPAEGMRVLAGDTASPILAPVTFPTRRLVIVLGLISALSALGGSAELILWPHGNRYVPVDLLRGTPFETFLVPGLLLGVVVGGSSLVCAMAVWQRSRAAVDLTVLAGGALTVWIAAEVALLRGIHFLHVVFGVLGVAILSLGVGAGWRSHEARHRWIFGVTLAEAMGFLVPATVGLLSVRAGIRGLEQAALVVTAGLVEGLALGAGQSWAFPLPVRRLRYTLLTSLGAAIVWLCVMSTVLLAKADGTPFAVVIIASVAAAVIGVGAIGAAQCPRNPPPCATDQAVDRVDRNCLDDRAST